MERCIEWLFGMDFNSGKKRRKVMSNVVRKKLGCWCWILAVVKIDLPEANRISCTAVKWLSNVRLKLVFALGIRFRILPRCVFSVFGGCLCWISSFRWKKWFVRYECVLLFWVLCVDISMVYAFIQIFSRFFFPIGCPTHQSISFSHRSNTSCSC